MDIIYVARIYMARLCSPTESFLVSVQGTHWYLQVQESLSGIIFTAHIVQSPMNASILSITTTINSALVVIHRNVNVYTANQALQAPNDLLVNTHTFTQVPGAH